MENIYVGRQPIVDIDANIFAYELLYRDKNRTSRFYDDRYASANVIANVLNKFGTKELLGDYKAFVKIDRKFLMSDLLFSVPQEFLILSILDTVAMDEFVIERIEQLHAKGYTIAINDSQIKEDILQRYYAILSKISFLKINDPKGEWMLFDELKRECKEHGITMIVTKIDTQESYELAKQHGCELVQGFFFAKPKIIENKRIDPTNLNVMHLYNLLLEDTSIDELTTAFEQNHEITIQLLRYMNSGAFHFRKKIASIHHVLVLLGRKTLAKWLMLLIYAKSTNKTAAKIPLMLMVKNRTNLMENILKLAQPSSRSNMVGEAYFVGVLSLLDVIFSVQLEEILQGLNISDEVKAALLEERGVLGEIFHVVKAIEYLDADTIERFLQKYKIKKEDFDALITKSMEDVNEFEKRI